LREHPAIQHSTERHPVWQPLFLRKGHGGFSALLGGTHLATELMECRRTTQGITQAEGVCKLQCQGHRFLALCQSLVSRAQIPQCPGGNAMAQHTTSLPIEERSDAVLLGVVKRYPLRHVCLCRGDRTQVEQRQS